MVAVFSDCSQGGKPEVARTNENSQLMMISQSQFESNKMKIGEITSSTFSEEVKCNGYIKAPSGAMAQLSSQVAGTVETINCAIGDFVRKGQILCSLFNNDVIILQQELIETSVRLKRLKSDYERSKGLLAEKISAEKDFIAIESEYKAMNAKYLSLKLRLEILKLNVAKIEAGEPVVTFPVTAPLSGFVTKQNISLGQFVEQQNTIMEIVDVSQLHLQLSVYESAVSRLKSGQAIYFKTTGEKDSVHQAVLTSVGKAIDPESRSIQCIAKIVKEEDTHFVSNAYVDAYVIVDKVQANALPNEAFVKSGQDYFVFAVVKEENQNYYVRKVKIRIGRSSGSLTEIIDDGSLKRIITQGAYNLRAE
jgi:cobalt-zinc-cadmium efflux system membrane fusion protein